MNAMKTFVLTSLFAGCAAAQGFNDRPPNGSDQEPAFENQTRAPALPRVAVAHRTVVDGLEHPWGMAQLPDGSWLVTERPGRLRLVAPDGTLSAPITGLPKVDAEDQGGLLDVIVGDDFADTRRLWVSFAERDPDNLTHVSVATGVLSKDATRVEDARVIWRQTPYPSTLHYGSRLVLDDKGGLFVTTGERGGNEFRHAAQDLQTTLGKVVRIDPLTGAPMGKPGVAGALPEIWSWGHRNMQGAALAPDGSLWTTEHGPMGGDELNKPQAGRNYGWPDVSYGTEYSGEQITEGLTQKEGTEQPVYYWDPSIAPSGLVFYEGEMFPDWNGDLLLGGLQSSSIVRLKLSGDRVVGEARYLQNVGRVRDVDVAQDGAIMLLTDEDGGALIRMTPR
ncbi:PQQ-dependent sugar dehydrogenase [Paracoccus seriniphilus]|uniref:Glucose/arabinose dehydrogenase, beta-propeller fold n=2 Tax=Paracoccus seriniphilus TaxID=184748 RepID=A0A239Q0P7_9RHOB|nr:PQQ-dependent sugar dehydrogenase [Paracoccus seriniphilus]WCR13971.1 PQQ-dependent sugar dehydrogenase [Paracoccus seriniphilus]SNT76000.1 Glucose/arabinose dehydrogenase, beta-propeller fold [Paracoccus seriniphilus]